MAVVTGPAAAAAAAAPRTETASNPAGNPARLAAQGEEYAYAFENPGVIRVALDRAHVKHDAPLGQAREAAFFPPMTGG